MERRTYEVAGAIRSRLVGVHDRDSDDCLWVKLSRADNHFHINVAAEAEHAAERHPDIE